ncbi:MAG: hypothetical protein QXK90_01215 [Candidatus Parvarchaeota archaeon]
MRYRPHLYLYIILQALLLLSMIAPYARAETGILEIIDVYWGESGREWAAMPGDRASLMVHFRSLIEDETICGLKVVLWPIDPHIPFPFSSVKEWDTAIVTYTDQKIGFGDKAEIAFDVKIKEDAVPGIYETYLYFFYYDCGDPEIPLIMRLQKVNIKIWPLPEFRMLDVSWLNAEGAKVNAGPGDVNKILSVTFTVPKYYEISDITATIHLDEHFSNLTGGKEVKTSYAGYISEGGYFTLKFPLRVEPKTVPGTYNLKLILEYYDKWLTPQSQEIYIPVTVTGNNKMELSVDIPTLVIGSTSTMNVKVANVGDTPIYSLKLTVSSDSLMVVNGEADVGELWPGKSSTYNFPIYVPEILSEGVYPISIQAEYFDSNGAKQTLSKIIKVNIKSQPTLSLAVHIEDPEILLGNNKEFTIVVKNTYNSSINNVIVNVNLENTPLISDRSIFLFYFEEIGPKGFAELRIPAIAPPSASTGVFYVRLSITYRNPYGNLRTDEVAVPIIIKPDLKLEFGSLTFSSTSVLPGESIDLSGNIYNNGLTTGKLCEVRVEASSPFILTDDSRYYIGDISSLSKASFTVTIDVAENARPGKYSGTLVISCSDIFGEVHEYSKVFEVEVAGSFAFSRFTQTTVMNTTQMPPRWQTTSITGQRYTTTSEESKYLSILWHPLTVISIILIAIAVVIVILLMKRRSLRGRQKEDETT